MPKPDSVYPRLFRLVIKFWPYMAVSTVAAVIFVALNSASMWLLASLVNNIIADFEELVRQQEIWKTTVDLSLNEKLKYWTNLIILKESPIETLKILCSVILGVFIVKNIFLYIKNVLVSFVQLRIVTELRNNLYSHIHSLSLNFFSNKRAGEISSIVLNDVQNMQAAFSTSFQKLFVEPINIVTFISLMFVISWKLTLITFIILPVAGVTIVTIGRSIRRKSRRTQVQIADIMDILTEALSSVRIVKAFVMETYEIQRFWKASEKYFQLLFRRMKLIHLSTPVTESLGVIIGVVLLWIGGMEVINHKGLTSEDFIRFLVLLFSTLNPIKQLSSVNVQLQTGAASAERVFQLLDTQPEIVDAIDAANKNSFENEIRLDQVHFKYEDGDGIVLEDISFTIKKGEVVALVGHSGAGKSTVADLIPRFYDVTSGAVLIDGMDIRKLSLESLRKMMGIVTQEIFLFNDTIRNNIAYGMASVSEEDVRTAAKAANALDFIEEMPYGFKSIIGEKGVKLSGGQKQRLAIARALLKNPPILILDEATSSLDTESESLVQQAIETLMEERTVLVIAHRLSTVVNADKIIVLQKGKIVEIGTHQDLIGGKGLYKRLYDIQFGDA